MEYNKEDIKVSVIVPNYNHAKYLRKRIDSIINQSFTDFELILLDDHSTDHSQEILLSYKNNPHVTHIELNTKNSGSPFLQWEKGICLAKGKYIWIAESDDYAEALFLETVVEQLERNTKAQLCFTGSIVINEDNARIETTDFDHWQEDGQSYIFKSLPYLKSKMLRLNSIYNASMVVFRKEGCLSGIRPEYRKMHYCGDWLFWIEQIRKGAVIEVHKKLNYFRKHPNNTTAKGTANGNSFKEMAFIRNYFYKEILTNRDIVEILLDKSFFYREVKHFPVSKSRKKELFKILAKDAKITFITYIIGKCIQLCMKYDRKGNYSSQRF